MPNDKEKIYRTVGAFSGPKLLWIQRDFERREIPWRVAGTSPKGGTKIQVESRYIDDAMAVLDIEVGAIQVGNNPATPLTIADIPDDHEWFKGQVISTPGAKPTEGQHKVRSLPESHDVDIPDHDDPDFSREVRMYDVESSNVSAIGHILHHDNDDITVYVIFKGNTLYRYEPCKQIVFTELLSQAMQVRDGIQEASVGSAMHHLIKAPADAGEIKCYRLDRAENEWVPVLPKSQRTKEMKQRVK